LRVGVLASAVLLVVLYAPFWIGLATFGPLFAQAGRPQWSLGAILVSLTGAPLGALNATLIRLLLAGVCAAVSVVLLRRLAASADGIVDTSVLLLLVALLCLPLAFYSHYLMPAVGLAAVAVDARLRALVLAIGCGAMINAVLGVDTFAGGPTGPLLDITGSVVLSGAVAVGLRVAVRATPRRLAAS
jgi:hypothetical protein